MMFIIQCSLILTLLTAAVKSRTRCVRVRGIVSCVTNTNLARNIQVTLYDRDDLPWETDDLMGKNITDANGSFFVEGCGYDFGFWNDPDPFILITHGCPSSAQLSNHHLVSRKTMVKVRQTFLPDEMNIGEVRLDLEVEQ
ncbi:hypothetical protein Tcan_18118 [Toxocara canis]|uniref:Transthyretin-like protein 52 n=1 Tax=Toxocara canis TaxID=6265 RepID=A0A0B2UTD6_TOXCA|nr:hypothetical protein Tcan_18118 [Toxocara canis]